jgi:hypothetical protein
MLQEAVAYLESIPWSNAVSILFGAAISAIVSYLLQRNSFGEARRQKESDKKEERRALGLNVFTKMIRIASTLEQLKQSVEGALARASAQNLQGQRKPFTHQP